jgi:hypothetical protein
MRASLTLSLSLLPFSAHAGVWPPDLGPFGAIVVASVFLLAVAIVALVSGMRRLAKWIFVVFLFLLVAASIALGATLRGIFAAR